MRTIGQVVGLSGGQVRITGRHPPFRRRTRKQKLGARSVSDATIGASFVFLVARPCRQAELQANDVTRSVRLGPDARCHYRTADHQQLGVIGRQHRPDALRQWSDWAWWRWTAVPNIDGLLRRRGEDSRHQPPVSSAPSACRRRSPRRVRPAMRARSSFRTHTYSGFRIALFKQQTHSGGILVRGETVSAIRVKHLTRGPRTLSRRGLRDTDSDLFRRSGAWCLVDLSGVRPSDGRLWHTILHSQDSGPVRLRRCSDGERGPSSKSIPERRQRRHLAAITASDIYGSIRRVDGSCFAFGDVECRRAIEPSWVSVGEVTFNCTVRRSVPPPWHTSPCKWHWQPFGYPSEGQTAIEVRS